MRKQRPSLHLIGLNDILNFRVTSIGVYYFLDWITSMPITSMTITSI